MSRGSFQRSNCQIDFVRIDQKSSAASEVRNVELAALLLPDLFGDEQGNKVFAPERMNEAGNEEGTGHDLRDIDVKRGGQAGGVRRHDDFLTSMNFHVFSFVACEVEARSTFEDDELGRRARMIFHHYGCARDCRRHRCSIDPGPAGILRDAQENRAVLQVHRSCSLVEAKNGVRAQARNGEIGKRQFRARLNARAHGSSVADWIVHLRRLRGGGLRQQIDILYDLRDAGFL